MDKDIFTGITWNTRTVLKAIGAAIILAITVLSFFEDLFGVYLTVSPSLGFSKPSTAIVRIPTIAADIARGETRKLPFGGFTWRVLDLQDDRALVITEGVIEPRPYHDKEARVTWETCALRAYLNGKFLEKFSEQELAVIRETLNVNADNQWFGTYGGRDTTDMVFLLSLEEVVKYFGDSGQLENKNPDWPNWIDDEYNKERVATINTHTYTWWLRSPGDSASSAVLVFPRGEILVSGEDIRVDSGVRPALWLNLSE